MKLSTTKALSRFVVGWMCMIGLGALWHHGIEFPAIMFISGHVFFIAAEGD